MLHAQYQSLPFSVHNQSLGSVQVEVHPLKADPLWRIALTRIQPPGQDKHHTQTQTIISPSLHATPILLVHGSFSNRHFWISNKGIGLAPYLASRGYDVWIVDLRGHGLSREGPDFSAITAEDHIQRDLPAAVSYVWNTTGRPMFLAGHSAGGIIVASYLSWNWPNEPERFIGVALFGAQLAYGEEFLKVPVLAFLCEALLKVLGRVPARLLGLGPEGEPASEMLEFIRWKKRGGTWQDSRGFSYEDGLKKVHIPVLAVAAAADRNDPPAGCKELMEAFGSTDKQFVLLGRDQGFTLDYDHIGMIVSKEAAKEVWPLLAHWMDEKRKARTASSVRHTG